MRTLVLSRLIAVVRARARTAAVAGIALAIAAGALSSTGCIARVHGGATVSAPEPSLAYVGPEVWVVEEYEEPVFYSSGSYWLYRNGYWYSSNVHYGGWARVSTGVVPVYVRGIDRPRSYVRYRARPGVRRRPAPSYRNHRDHRTHRPPARQSRPRGTVQTRDYRAPASRKQSKVRVHQPQRTRPSKAKPRDHRTDDRDKKQKKRDPRDHRDHR